jgi:hypothetical protein
MKLNPIVALVMSLTAASYPSVHVVAQVATRGPFAQQAATTISGTVLRGDRTTPASNVRLRLRKVDTNAIVGRTTSGRDGAFSFPVAEPGTYVVEAVDNSDQGVLAVSGALNTTVGALTTTVVLSSTQAAASFFTSTAFLVVAAAGAAGIAVAASQSGDSVSSPER